MTSKQKCPATLGDVGTGGNTEQQNLTPGASDMQAAALAYAARGWPVIPLHSIRDDRCTCGRANCDSPAKHPLTPQGLKNASRDTHSIVGWWERWPFANAGILTGEPSGFIVLDVDPRHGGDESLAHLIGECGPLPETVEALTGGGGRHLLFAHPGRAVRNRVAIAPGLDLRADGGYIVAPPSIHASGRRYEWESSSSPDAVAIAPAPVWLVNGFTLPVSENVSCSRRTQKRPEEAEAIIASGSSGSSGSSGTGRGFSEIVCAIPAVEEAVRATQPTNEGQRNRRIFELARRLKGIIPDATSDDLRVIVREWHRRALPVIGTKPFDTTWADFCYGLERVKWPHGCLLDEIVRRARAATVPTALAARYDSRETNLLICICIELQAASSGCPFYLSWRTAAALLGIDHTSAGRLLGMLVKDRVLAIAEQHTARRAARYDYIEGTE